MFGGLPRRLRLWARRAFLFGVALGIIGVAATPRALAQRGLDVDRFRPAVDRHGFLGIQGTRTPGPFRFNAGLSFVWVTSPLTINRPNDERDVIKERFTTHLLLQLGLGNRVGVAADIPFILHQAADERVLTSDAEPIATRSFGDPRIFARFRILGESSAIERERTEGFGFALLGGTTLPVGDEVAFTGEQGFVPELAVLADYHLFGAGVGATVGWRHRFEDAHVLATEFHDELTFGLGLKVPIPITYDFLGYLEVRGSTEPSDFFTRVHTPVEGDIGFSLRREAWLVTAGLGTGLSSGVGAPSIRAFANVTWSSAKPDADGDGLPDETDQCPHLAEDFDDFEDDDGCLDPDNDNDMVPDSDDRCPNDPSGETEDYDSDGCTDSAPNDLDGDRILNESDRCPRDAEDRDQFEDEDGCPDLDNDRDGLNDGSDRCPTISEDRDAFEDEDGCPDPDNDRDGIQDSSDECPSHPEDVDEIEDDDGCPDPDNDRDGVADTRDRCPAEAETINGVDDDDGCPDEGGRVLWELRAEGQGALALVGQLRFAGDGLDAGMEPSLDQLARHLTARLPHRLHVAVGSDNPLRLRAIRSALIQRGIPDDSLDVITDTTLPSGRVVVWHSVQRR